MAGLQALAAGSARAAAHLDLAPEAIVSKFVLCDPETLDRSAFEAAMANPAAVRLLVESLDESAAQALARLEQARERGRVYMLPSIAMMLLSALRHEAAHKPICRFFAEGGEDATHVTGSLVTEALAIILARTCNGDPTHIHRLALSQGADPFARGAAVRSLAILAHQGRIDEVATTGFVKELLESAPLADSIDLPSTEWDCLIMAAVDFRSQQLLPVIKSLCERGFLNRRYFTWQEIEAHHADPVPFEDNTELNEAKHDDIVACLDSQIVMLIPFDDRPEPDEALDDDDDGSILIFKDQNLALTHIGGRPVIMEIELGTPYRRPEPKVGRNALCPCGSGKKYKKCCIED